MTFYLQKRELLKDYWEITRELMGGYWGIEIICTSGIERIVFDIILPSFLTLYFVAYI